MVEMREWSRSQASRFVRVPTVEDDKYSRGVVGLRTGSREYPGAAVLGVEAAWRAGAGFVSYVGAGKAADAVLARRPETVVSAGIAHTRIDAWVIGSGTDPDERSVEEEAALRGILVGSVPVVVDAGALDLLEGCRAPLLLTPHAGEFAGLCARFGIDSSGERESAVARAAMVLNATVLLKGARTLIAAADGRMIAVEAGTGWLATAGSGDVLAGVLGALLAANRGADPAEVAATAAWLHGRAGVVAAGAEKGPGHPIVAVDVAEALPRAIAELLA